MKIISTKLVSLISIYLYFALTGCVSLKPTEEYSTVIPVVNKAIPMDLSHNDKSGLNLYGIYLGESKGSVEDKYKLVACRRDIFYVRCAAMLNTTDTAGIINDNKATLFIAFKKDHVHNISMPVFTPSFDFTENVLYKIYGSPDSKQANKVNWADDGGYVVLQKSIRTDQPSAVIYTVSLEDINQSLN